MELLLFKVSKLVSCLRVIVLIRFLCFCVLLWPLTSFSGQFSTLEELLLFLYVIISCRQQLGTCSFDAGWLSGLTHLRTCVHTPGPQQV